MPDDREMLIGYLLMNEPDTNGHTSEKSVGHL